MAQDRRVDAGWNHDGAVADLSRAVLHWIVGLELTDMNSENEIKQGLLAVCKVKGWDSDINIVGFHALCDELKALGADEEREACAKACEKVAVDSYTRIGREHEPYMRATAEDCARHIRARGNT